MKVLSASLVIFATFLLNYQVKSEDTECFYACTYIHDPVCGDNGSEFMYFGNECFMNAHNECNKQSKLSDRLNSRVHSIKHPKPLNRFHPHRGGKLSPVLRSGVLCQNPRRVILLRRVVIESRRNKVKVESKSSSVAFVSSNIQTTLEVECGKIVFYSDDINFYHRASSRQGRRLS